MIAESICMGVLLTILVIGVVMDVLGQKRFVGLLNSVWPTLQFGSRWSTFSYALNVSLLLYFLARIMEGGR